MNNKNPFVKICNKIVAIKNIQTNKIRNKAFFRKGGYSLAITAVTLAIIVFVNYLVGVLSSKINLEFDMTDNNTNSLSAENVEYLKGISENVDIIVCSKKTDYTGYLLSYASQLFGVQGDERYFNQTLKFLEKYNDISDNINVKFVDVQSAEYTTVTQTYSDYTISYGDIIVSRKSNDIIRSKQVSFKNIYTLVDESGYAAYGYDVYTINGNNIESALTSAISYVVNNETRRFLLYTGHSKGDNGANGYLSMLEKNGYEVKISDSAFLADISDTFDAVAILAPSNDFIESEIAELSNFLYNDGKGGKGVIVFMDSINPALPNLYDFLDSWGIEVGDGVLYETNQKAIPLESKRSALFSLPSEQLDYTKDMNGFITGYNVPMKIKDQISDKIQVYSVASTLQSVINAPSGAGEDWADYTEDQLCSYETVIESKSTDCEKPSYVFAFSSIEFVYSDWAENNALANKDLVLKISEISSGNVSKSKGFVPKKITHESFVNNISVKNSTNIKNIFVIAIPIIMMIWGICVFVKRRNSK